MPKIKVKRLPSKIKEIKKGSSKDVSHNLESEIEVSETENFARFLKRKKADSTLEEAEITPIGRVTRISLPKEDERETNFRPSYTGSGNYQTNQTYAGAEAGGNLQPVKDESQNQRIDKQDQFAVRTASEDATGQTNRGEREGRREYVGKEKQRERKNR